ncbi:glutaredoxin family protein [Bacillus sp. SCS-153A]|uniref:glutaredoxin family protein n=1 Tax=Rossellomorea sedimentorum TaxID=3115294 RepID=UPI003905A2E2
MILLYTMDGCRECFKVKQLLNARQLDYEEKNIFEDAEDSEILLKELGEIIVPVLRMDSCFFVGSEIYSYLSTKGHVR